MLTANEASYVSNANRQQTGRRIRKKGADIDPFSSNIMDGFPAAFREQLQKLRWSTGATDRLYRLSLMLKVSTLTQTWVCLIGGLLGGWVTGGLGSFALRLPPCVPCDFQHHRAMTITCDAWKQWISL